MFFERALLKCKTDQEKFELYCKFGDEIDIKEYINKGININYQDEDGYTGLMWGIITQNIDTVKYLCKQENINVDIQNKHGETALMLALAEDNIIISNIMTNSLISKSNLNITDNENCTVVMHATFCNRTKYFKKLITNINIDVQDNDGFTALMYACEDNNINFIKILIKKGCNKELINKDNKKAIDYITDEDLKIKFNNNFK